jgi:hypothetical protein
LKAVRRWFARVGSKQSFFEKKDQKAFVRLGGAGGGMKVL